MAFPKPNITTSDNDTLVLFKQLCPPTGPDPDLQVAGSGSGQENAAQSTRFGTKSVLMIALATSIITLIWN